MALCERVSAAGLNAVVRRRIFARARHVEGVLGLIWLCQEEALRRWPLGAARSLAWQLGEYGCTGAFQARACRPDDRKITVQPRFEVFWADGSPPPS